MAKFGATVNALCPIIAKRNSENRAVQFKPKCASGEFGLLGTRCRLQLNRRLDHFRARFLQLNRDWKEPAPSKRNVLTMFEPSVGFLSSVEQMSSVKAPAQKLKRIPYGVLKTGSRHLERISVRDSPHPCEKAKNHQNT
jgi:hypothetical protein